MTLTRGATSVALMRLPSTATSYLLLRRPRRVAWLRQLLLLLGCLLWLLSHPQQARASGDAKDILKARRVAHFVAYVADDYPAAVRAGKQINKFEHTEQLALLDDAHFDLQDLGKRGSTLMPALLALRQLVQEMASHEQVRGAAKALRADLIGMFRLQMLPTVAPDRARGRALFREHCSECHGAAGTADTPKARTLTPAPISFLHPSVIERLSPLRVTDTTRFGVTGTAMVPLAHLSAEERWQVAFYLMGLRHTPRTTKRTPAFSFEDLAISTDGELLDEMFGAGLRGVELLSALAELRTSSCYRDDRIAPLTALRARLAVAGQMIGWSDWEAADHALVRGQRGGAQLARGQLAQGSAHELDERISQLRSRLRDERPNRTDLQRDIAVLQRLVTREQLRLAAPPRRGFLPALTAGASVTARACLLPTLAVVALALLVLGPRPERTRSRLSKRAISAAALALPLGLVNLIKPSAALSLAGAGGVAIAATLSIIIIVVLLAATWTSKQGPDRARRLDFRLLLLAVFALVLQAVLETSVQLTAQLQLHEDGFTALLGGGATLGLAAAFTIEAAIAGREASASLSRVAASVVALLLAVVWVGQLTHQLQLSALLPIDAFAWIGQPTLGIYPTLQTLTGQGAALLCAGLMGWQLRGRHLGQPRGQVQSSNQK